jgi:LCP family protein required for cell wall assembly
VVINAGEQAVRPGAAPAAPAPAYPSPAPPAAPGRVVHPPSFPPPAGPIGPPPGPVYPGVPGRPGPGRGLPGRRPKLKLRRLVLPLCSFPVLLGLLLFGLAYKKFGEIPRAPVKEHLSEGGGAGTNWLIVGADSREGITADDPNAGAFIGGAEPSGNRTDSIMVLRIAGGKQTLLSIPRDLLVKDPKTGQTTRVNGTFNAGPANLIEAVKNLGIPVHHYLEINFVGFGKLVDSVGGIDVNFPFPARDTHSGLDVPEAGVRTLDSVQALAYTRSRFYEELKDGKWVKDPLSDLSRVQRQRTFLTALMKKVTDTRNPFTLLSVTGAMSGGMKIDDGLSLFGAIGLALSLRGFAPESVTLPNKTVAGSGALEFDKAKGAPVIAEFAA